MISWRISCRSSRPEAAGAAVEVGLGGQHRHARDLRQRPVPLGAQLGRHLAGAGDTRAKWNIAAGVEPRPFVGFCSFL